MAKFLASFVLLLCMVTIANASTGFTIQGRVYCDTCRAGFETSATEYIADAGVKLECRNYTNNEITKTAKSKTDGSGTYNIKIKNTHDEEVCEVVLVDSPRKDCTETKSGRDRARVLLTKESGITSDVRFANSLGFLINEPLQKCGKLLQQYALSDDLE